VCLLCESCCPDEVQFSFDTKLCDSCDRSDGDVLLKIVNALLLPHDRKSVLMPHHLLTVTLSVSVFIVLKQLLL